LWARKTYRKDDILSTTGLSLVEHHLQNQDLYFGRSRYEAVMTVFEKGLFSLFESIFIKTRSFDMGMEFFNICWEELHDHKSEMGGIFFRRYISYLIELRLKMLDYQNRWQDYINYTHEVIENYPFPQELNENPFARDLFYIETPTGRKQHFLSWNQDRYDKTTRKIQRQEAGKSVEHLKRHQQAELSAEEIERRYKTIVYFFRVMNSSFFTRE